MGLQCEEKTIGEERRFIADKPGDEKLKIGPLPVATQKRIIKAVCVVLVVAGAITLATGVSGVLGFVEMDAQTKFGLFVLGIAMLLTGILRINLIEFVV